MFYSRPVFIYGNDGNEETSFGSFLDCGTAVEKGGGVLDLTDSE